MTIWLNKFLPGFGDRYLAKQGYDSQQTSQPVDPNRPFNLFEPVAGDHGAHGMFDQRYEALDDAVSVDWGAHRHQCQHCGQHGQR